MKAIDYINRYKFSLNRDKLTSLLADEGVEMTDELWAYLTNTPENINPRVLKQYGIDIEKTSEDGGSQKGIEKEFRFIIPREYSGSSGYESFQFSSYNMYQGDYLIEERFLKAVKEKDWFEYVSEYQCKLNTNLILYYTINNSIEGAICVPRWDKITDNSVWAFLQPNFEISCYFNTTFIPAFTRKTKEEWKKVSNFYNEFTLAVEPICLDGSSLEEINLQIRSCSTDSNQAKDEVEYWVEYSSDVQGITIYVHSSLEEVPASIASFVDDIPCILEINGGINDERDSTLIDINPIVAVKLHVRRHPQPSATINFVVTEGSIVEGEDLPQPIHTAVGRYVAFPYYGQDAIWYVDEEKTIEPEYDSQVGYYLVTGDVTLYK